MKKFEKRNVKNGSRLFTTTDPKFWVAAQNAKKKYAKTLQMLKESDR